MATAIRIVMTAPIISIPKNFHMNLIQFDHSIFAIAREPIRQPEVGTIRFVKGITELERKDGCLAGYAEKVRERCHDRHGDRRLAGARYDERN